MPVWVRHHRLQTLQRLGPCWLFLSTMSIVSTAGFVASEARAFDWSIKAGAGLGNIQRQGTAGSQVFTFGGIPIAVGAYSPWSLDETLFMQGQVLLDVINTQVAMQGIEGGYLYHLLGGPREIRLESGSRIHSSSALSLGVSAGLFGYSAVNQNDITVKVEGQTFEFQSILELRFSRNTGVSFSVPLYSLPTTSKRILPQVTKILFFQRF